MTPPSLRPTMTPVAYERFAVEFMMDRQMHEDLRRAQALLGHQVPTGELGRIFGRALQSLIRELEKNKFGVRRPGADGERAAMPVTSANPRYIPKHVRRLVWERDQGRCTFVGESGQRCPATNALEFDHVQPVAQGGTSAPGNLRLRCRAHNQLDAEREFGPEYMAEMRQRAPSS